MAVRAFPTDHPPFAALPVRMITVGRADDRLAVHVAGRLTSNRLPLVCLPGYTRNMSDFTAFVALVQRQLGAGWPVVLVDLRGRGRSDDRHDAEAYTTIDDAADVGEMARALAIEAAVFVGQGHGGQVLMALAAIRSALIAGAILLDAGPVMEPRSLIRLRSNIKAIAASRGATGVTMMLRRMLGTDYPGLKPEELDLLAARGQWIDAQGRARPLFDETLMQRLDGFDQDDVLVPQWQFLDLLNQTPVLLARTEFTDQVSRELFGEMQSRLPHATTLQIAGQGSPALLDRSEEIRGIADFVTALTGAGTPFSKRAPTRRPAPRIAELR
jgi:pimeloyl-ACP methyl ester carboxylesterase